MEGCLERVLRRKQLDWGGLGMCCRNAVCNVNLLVLFGMCQARTEQVIYAWQGWRWDTCGGFQCILLPDTLRHQYRHRELVSSSGRAAEEDAVATLPQPLGKQQSADKAKQLQFLLLSATPSTSGGSGSGGTHAK